MQTISNNMLKLALSNNSSYVKRLTRDLYSFSSNIWINDDVKIFQNQKLQKVLFNFIFLL